MKVIQLAAATDETALHNLNVSGLTEGMDQLNVSDMNESSILNDTDTQEFCEHTSSTPNRSKTKSPKEMPGNDDVVTTVTSPQREDSLLNCSLFQTPVKQQSCHRTEEFYRVCSTTKCHVVRESEGVVEESRTSRVTFQNIGGMSSQIAAIKETVMLPLKSPHLFSSSGWLV